MIQAKQRRFDFSNIHTGSESNKYSTLPVAKDAVVKFGPSYNSRTGKKHSVFYICIESLASYCTILCMLQVHVDAIMWRQPSGTFRTSELSSFGQLEKFLQDKGQLIDLMPRIVSNTQWVPIGREIFSSKLALMLKFMALSKFSKIQIQQY